VVILLGNVATKDFLLRYAGRQVHRVAEVWGVRHECEIVGLSLVVFPIPHPAYRFDSRNVQRVCQWTAAAIREILMW
jgi:uracil-DNA glycosylase